MSASKFFFHPGIPENQVKANGQPVAAGIIAGDTDGGGHVLRYIPTDIIMSVIIVCLPQARGVDDLLLQFSVNCGLSWVFTYWALFSR